MPPKWATFREGAIEPSQRAGFPPKRAKRDDEQLDCLPPPRGCGEIKPWHCFTIYQGRDGNNAADYERVCKACKAERQKARRAEPKGIISQHVGNAKSRHEKRKVEGRDQGGCDIPSGSRGHTPPGGSQQVQWFFDVAAKSDYKCYVSGVDLDPYYVSLERQDENLSYSIENTWMVHPDFQSGTRPDHESESPAQWSPQKFEAVKSLRSDKEHVLKELEESKKLWKAARDLKKGEFGSGQELRSGSTRTPAQELHFRLRNAANQAKQRGHKEPSEIDIPYLFVLHRRQGGRCAYTRVPLRVSGEWKFSLERIVDKVGYTKANTCLVVQEVNHGNNQRDKWSKQKADEYWGATNV